jgi:hypothetical protein
MTIQVWLRGYERYVAFVRTFFALLDAFLGYGLYFLGKMDLFYLYDALLDSFSDDGCGYGVRGHDCPDAEPGGPARQAGL